MEKSEEKLISLQEASQVSPYSADYLSLIVRKGKLEGFKKSGKWFTTKKAVEDYTQRVAESNYQRQGKMNVRIPALENQKALVNLKWALALAGVFVLALTVWGIEQGKADSEEFKIEKDSQNNLIIYADNPDEIRAVKVVPKD